MNATETRYANLNKLTVPVLKEIASRMGVDIPSKTKKADIINAIMVHVEVAHNEAAKMNAVVTYTVEGTNVTFSGVSAQFMIEHERRVKRYNPLLKRDKGGSVILTAKQYRRVQKKDRKFAKKLGLFNAVS